MSAAPSLWVASFVALIAAAPVAAQSPESLPLFRRIDEVLVSREATLVAVRHDIHRHPEVSGHEARTAALVAVRLRELGFDVRTGIGGHGVVGLLRGDKDGPLVAFRADMDAVPSTAPDPADYRSFTQGVRHICGHDVHVTVGLGLAEGFAAVRNELPGSVMLIFQPAEETATGAKAMLADGVFAPAMPAAVYAIHTAPYSVGILGTAAGGMMAGRARIQVTLTGTGDLAAAADSVRQVIQRVGTLAPALATQAPPDGFIMAVVFPGRGVATSDAALTVRGQVTTASPTARAQAKRSILTNLDALALPNVSLAVSYDDRAIAGVTNDSALVDRANASVRSVLGEESVVRVNGVPPIFSEDFGSFQEEIPGVMYLLGVSNPATGTVGMPHADDYVADDAAILVGVRAMTAVLLERLTGS